MTISVVPGNSTNYLVPSSGSTHAVNVEGVFSTVPELINWAQFSVDNFPFIPQGVFIDNSAGTGDLIIEILPIKYKIKCPAGIVLQAQFPAPSVQTASIIGDGAATIVFVDFPVLPSSGLVDIGNTVDVKLISESLAAPLPTIPTVNSAGIPYQVDIAAASSTTPLPTIPTVNSAGIPYQVDIAAASSTTPLPTIPTVNSAGTPYQVDIAAASITTPIQIINKVPAAPTILSGNITGTSLGIALSAPPNKRLLRFMAFLSGDLTLASPGRVDLSLTLNNILLFVSSLYLPSVLAAVTVPAFVVDIDFNDMNIETGAGNFVVANSLPFATGDLHFFAYFGD